MTADEKARWIGERLAAASGVKWTEFRGSFVKIGSCPSGIYLSGECNETSGEIVSPPVRRGTYGW